MMTKNFNRLFKTVCGIFATAALLTGCSVDAPEIPAEEIYLRNFIKQYGLVDPNQNFISAEQSNVTVHLDDYAEDINVYALVGDYYYRVAYYSEVDGTVTIPVDVPKGTPELMVVIDNDVYYTKPGGTIDTTRRANATSRVASNQHVASWMNWSTTGKESVTLSATDGQPTTGTAYNNYILVDKTAVIGGNTNQNTETASVVGNYGIENTVLGTNVHFQIVNNYETASTYVLNLKAISPNVATINLAIIDQNGHYYMNQDVNLRKFSASLHLNSSSAEQLEFTTALMPKGTYQLVVTVTEVLFDADGYTSGGEWGYISIKKSQEVKDMAWLMVCEDLGSTDDFDFNDIIIRIEAVNLNNVAVERLGLRRWQVIEDNDQHINLHNAPSRYAQGEYTKLKITALCAGGTLPLWLHYKENNGTDYIVCPGKEDSEARVLANTVDMDSYEWHRWFGVSNVKQMINTGIGMHIDGLSTTMVVSGYSMSKFSFLDYDGTFDTIEGGIDDVDRWDGLVKEWKYFTENSNACINGFYITVRKPTIGEIDATHLSALPAGVPPQMFLIPDCSPTEASGYSRHYGWEWPMERVSILDVYPNFKDWVNGTKPSNIEANWPFNQSAWFLNPAAGIVDDDNMRYSRDPNHSSQNLIEDF